VEIRQQLWGGRYPPFVNAWLASMEAGVEAILAAARPRRA